LNTVTVFSSLLLIAAIVAAFRSGQTVDDLHWSKWEPAGDGYTARMVHVMSYDGLIWIGYDRIEYITAKLAAMLQTTTPPGLSMRNSPLLFPDGTKASAILGDHAGIKHSRLDGPAIHLAGWSMREPIWLFILVMALVPATRLIWRIRMSRKTQPSRCRSCGYDLPATPNRCPECGTVQAKPTGTA